MRIAYSPYELRKSLDRFRVGALLRVIFDDGVIGYADCHPWPELGDLPIDQQILKLQQKQPTSLGVRSLYFARLDGEYRDKRQNILSEVKIPPSHWLITHLEHVDYQNKQFLEFNCFKVKIGGRLKTELQHLKKLMHHFPSKDARFRLDFNEKLTPETFQQFWESLGDFTERVEYCEDPFPYHGEMWSHMQKKYSVSFACDRQSQQAISHPGSANTLVIKPALQDERLFVLAGQNQKLVVTSYLDHPFGQLCAAYVAATLPHHTISGLFSHTAYEINPFSAQLITEGTRLLPVEGTGFGFDSLLEQLIWTD